MTDDSSPWGAGRLRGSGRQKLLFGTMYEDVEVERTVLHGRQAVFAIAASGDTAMTLAAEGREVVAVDVNRAQVEYVRHRLHGGPQVCGVADRLLTAVRRLAPVAGWTSSRVQRFLELGDVRTQQRVFEQVLNTFRFRRLVDSALGPTALLRAYRPAFVDFLPIGFGPVIRHRIHRGISTHPNRTNPYAALLFSGARLQVPRPPVDCLDVRHIDALAFLESQPTGRFDGFTLSNILDGPDASFRAHLAAAVRRAGMSDSPVVLRSFRNPTDHETRRWAARDRSMIWGTLAVVEASRFPEFVEQLS